MIDDGKGTRAIWINKSGNFCLQLRQNRLWNSHPPFRRRHDFCFNYLPHGFRLCGM